MSEQSSFEPRLFKHIKKLFKTLLFFGAITFYAGLTAVLCICLGKLGLTIVLLAVVVLVFAVVLILVFTGREPLHDVNTTFDLDNWLIDRKSHGRHYFYPQEEKPGSEKKPTYH